MLLVCMNWSVIFLYYTKSTVLLFDFLQGQSLGKKHLHTNIHQLEVIKLQKGVCKKLKGFPNLVIKFCYKVKCVKLQYKIDCEIQSCVILFFTGRGSKRPLSSPVREVDKPDIEVWALTDVVFVEDIRCAPIGKVLKVGFIYWNNFMSCSHVMLVSLWYFL